MSEQGWLVTDKVLSKKGFKMEHLFLRTCGPNGESYGDFRWNLEIGAVNEAPDWNEKSECGGGLHGLYRGEGGGGLLRWDAEAKWVVFSGDVVVKIDDQKAKTRRAAVLFVGDRKGATDFLIEKGCDRTKVVGCYNTGGDRSTNTGGYRSTNTGGDESTNTGGDWSTNTGGDGSTNTGGYGAIVSGGEGSVLSLYWWDGRRKRISSVYVGEGGILPGVKYKLDENGKFVKMLF